MAFRRPTHAAAVRRHLLGIGERGAAAVEFAIVLPLVLLLIGGIVDLGRMMFYQQLLTNGAREGARTVAIGYSQGAATNRVNDATDTIAGGVSTAYAYSSGGGCPNNPGANDTVTATVTANDFQWLVLGVAVQLVGGNIPAPTLRASTTMRCGG